MNKPQMSEEYHKLARRYGELFRLHPRRTIEEENEMRELSQQMEPYEMALRQEQNTIALAASDYDQARMVGDLGGVEIL